MHSIAGESADRIASYARAYVHRFNELAAQLKDQPLPIRLYADPIEAVCMFAIEEAFVLFYLPHEAASAWRLPPGISQYSPDQKSIEELLQSMTFNLVKISTPPEAPLKADLSNLSIAERIPADLPLDQIEGVSLSSELREAILEYGTLNTTGLAVSPIRRYKNGLVEETLPTRAHIYSPSLKLPDGRVIRQFQWPFADLLWEPTGLNLSASDAAEFVRADLDVLLLGFEIGIPEPHLLADPFETVSQHLHAVCDEFKALLDDPETGEPEVQAFLEQRANTFLVSPVHRSVHPRLELGGGRYIPDFTVVRPDGEIHFVEIENPQREIFQSVGEEQSAHLTHAISQVEDWLRFVDENRDSVRREDGLQIIFRPTGEVVAGRDDHLGDAAARRFAFKRSESTRIFLKTYDMLLQEARVYADMLREMKGTASSMPK